MYIKNSAVNRLLYLSGLLSKRPMIPIEELVVLTYSTSGRLLVNIANSSLVACEELRSDEIIVENGDEDFSVAVNATKFFATLRTINGDASLRLTPTTLAISNGNIKVNLAKSDGTGFSFLEFSPEIVAPVATNVFDNLVKTPKFVAQESGTFSGVILRRFKGVVDYFATDRTQMYYSKPNGQTPNEAISNFAVILPIETIMAISKLPTDETIDIGATDTLFHLSQQDANGVRVRYIVSRLIAGEIPTLDRVLANRSANCYTIEDSKALVKFIKLYTTITELEVITWDFKDDVLTITGTGMDANVAYQSNSNTTTNISIKVDHALNALSIVDGVEICAEDGLNTIFFVNDDQQIILTKIRRF